MVITTYYSLIIPYDCNECRNRQPRKGGGAKRGRSQKTIMSCSGGEAPPEALKQAFWYRSGASPFGCRSFRIWQIQIWVHQTSETSATMLIALFGDQFSGFFSSGCQQDWAAEGSRLGGGGKKGSDVPKHAAGHSQTPRTPKSQALEN